MHAGKRLLAGAMTAAAVGAAVIGISVSSASSGNDSPGSSVAATAAVASSAPTTTPIKHVVVLFDENISFDHYFGTYPYAANLPGENPFHAARDTPTVNGLNGALLTANPNENNPQRLGLDQALTCDQNHSYTPEQSAFDGGLMDKFVQDTTGGGCFTNGVPNQSDLNTGSYGPNGIVMDYYDGNTVTGLWNLAQHFTLNDNSYDTQFGPSSPGAINVVSGNTAGAVAEGGTSANVLNGTLNGDAEPYFDQCSNASTALSTTTLPGSGALAPGGVTAELTGKNIGDLLNTKGLTWGWFQGGFTPSEVSSMGRPICGTQTDGNTAGTHENIGGAKVADYSEHHEPFQYYQSTSNPTHLSPADVAQVGTGAPDGVNHQYDLSWFNQSVASGDMPAVSYLKAPEYEDGHAGYSDPLDEQRFIAQEVDQIEQSPDWASTAIFIAYDDSDGWYDHQMGPIVRGSQDAADMLNGPGKCGSSAVTTPTTTDRCGVGPRLPMLVISPWAKQNYVDNTFTEQASIPKFIESNWSLGPIGNGSADLASGTLDNAFDFDQSYGHAPAVILDPATGEVTKTIPPTTAPTSSSTTSSSSSSSAPSGPGGSSSAGSGGSGGGSSGSGAGKGGGQTVTVTLPKVSCTDKVNHDKLTLTCTTKGGSTVTTSLRLRAYHSGHLIADHAAKVHNHRARFGVKLRQREAGTYRFVVSIDAGGKVGKLTRSVRVR
jgi:phospholipase C